MAADMWGLTLATVYSSGLRKCDSLMRGTYLLKADMQGSTAMGN